MKKTLRQVNYHDIDLSDRRYVFTFEPLISPMTQSIKTIGLINPPVLARKSEQPPYRIVSGLKRILALIHLKIDTFPAHIIEETSDGPDVDLFMLNFYENISTR